jgi:hypothetical protein
MPVPTKRAVNCKWARPTLEEPLPIWLEVEARPWTCERGTLHPLESTELCESCGHWEERVAEVESAARPA